MQVTVLPTTTGFGVQVTDPPAAIFTMVVTGTVFKLKAAVTVHALVVALVTYGLLAEAAPQLLVVNSVNVYPAFAVAVQVAVLPNGTGLAAQLTVPPAAGVTAVVMG